MKRIVFNFQGSQDRVKNRLSMWQQNNFVRRLQAKDSTLWFSTSQADITDRLGWLNLPEEMPEKLVDFYAFCDEIQSESYSHVVLCGMGGSSLAPGFFGELFGSGPGHPSLVVLDSTHPEAIEAVEKKIDNKKPLFVISSKSGTTLETLSLCAYFFEKIKSSSQTPGRHFAAITDPDSPLDSLALNRGFRKVFYAPTDVGGRFSALSEFGLLPAALLGVDVPKLLEKAKFAAKSCAEDDEIEEKASCLFLGAFLGELSSERNKMTILASHSLRCFSGWLEQLVAESTGKDGRGIIPIVDEPYSLPETYGDDRFFVSFFLDGEDSTALENEMQHIERLGFPTVRIYLKDKYEISQEIFRWEVAVALAGSVMGIHPFNQPDVQLTKDLTKKVLEENLGLSKDGDGEKDSLPVNDATVLDRLTSWLSLGKPGDYVSIQAFLPPLSEMREAVQRLRKNLLRKTNLATSVGFGPRYLHSTGQIHKGGPNSGLFLQLVDDPKLDLPVPETNYTFRSLIQAQAWGDFHSLREKKRRVLRINLGAHNLEGLNRLARMTALKEMEKF